MKNLPCVIWLIGSIFTNIYAIYVYEYLLKKEYSSDVEFISNILFLIIWAFVGFKLYEPTKK